MLNLSHKKLEVYQLGLQIILEVYFLTRLFPKEEQYVLVSQLRRAVISVNSNIAEGASRRSKHEKKRFFEIARSSLVEVDTQLEMALLLGYINETQTKKLELLIESAFRMLSKMITGLDNNPTNSSY